MQNKVRTDSVYLASLGMLLNLYLRWLKMLWTVASTKHYQCIFMTDTVFSSYTKEASNPFPQDHMILEEFSRIQIEMWWMERRCRRGIRPRRKCIGENFLAILLTLLCLFSWQHLNQNQRKWFYLLLLLISKWLSGFCAESLTLNMFT